MTGTDFPKKYLFALKWGKMTQKVAKKGSRSNQRPYKSRFCYANPKARNRPKCSCLFRLQDSLTINIFGRNALLPFIFYMEIITRKSNLVSETSSICPGIPSHAKICVDLL